MSELATKVDWNKLSLEAVTEITTWVKGARDFVTEQAPELVREVLAWGFWSQVVWATIYLFIALSFAFVLRKLVKFGLGKAEEHDWDDNEIIGFKVGMIFSHVPVLVFFILTMIKVSNAVYIHIAPRMYLLSYLKKLTT